VEMWIDLFRAAAVSLFHSFGFEVDVDNYVDETG